MDAQEIGFPRYTLFLLLFGLSCATGPALAATITVNTATDDFGSNLSNCSLREAIESANDNFDFGGCSHSGVYGDLFADNINLPELDPPGAFTLTRYTGHDNANNSTDLDIIGSVRIRGFSAANTIIRGDTSDPDDQRERIFHILEGTVTLEDMTIRDGFVDSGGDGGGLRTEPGSTTILNRVVVGLNIADGNGGGIWNRGTMTLNASAVTNNVTQSADVGGGGIYNTGVLNINDSRILTNRTEGLNVEGNGAGIYSLAELNMVNSHVNGNEIDVESALAEPIEGEGGGLYLHGTFHIEDSTISNNIARGRDTALSSDGANGGGVFCTGTAVGTIERTLITGNDALNMGLIAISSGGGIAGCNGLVIMDSVISANLSEGSGGGITMNGAQMLRTTVYNNRADRFGGGIANAGEVVNSTIANNTAGLTGGGVGAGGGSFHNCTITGNIAENDDSAAVSAGGITGNATIMNTVIAGNTDNVNSSEDCAGTLNSLNYNLIQNATGCGGLNQEGLDKLNVQAELEALTANGGIMVGATVGTVAQQAMLTRMPQPDSNVLEIGDPAGCKDADGVLLLTDQIGRDRTEQGFDFNLGAPGVCDAGALEFSFVVFEDGFE